MVLISVILEIQLTKALPLDNLRNMSIDLDSAASLLQQMGNKTRLEIVRLLVRAGQTGMPVGNIQDQLEIPGSTLSHHLSKLRSVGLVKQSRVATTLYCCVDYELLDEITSFLSDECCISENNQ